MLWDIQIKKLDKKREKTANMHERELRGGKNHNNMHMRVRNKKRESGI